MIITKQYYYDTDKWYVLETGESLNEEIIEEGVKGILDKNVEYANKEIGVSMSVLTLNLLKDHLD